MRPLLGLALAVAMVGFGGDGRAQTPAGVYSGCQFSACQLNTAECCRQANAQYSACLQNQGVNAQSYPSAGKLGAAARAAVGECAFCSSVFVKTFCKR